MNSPPSADWYRLSVEETGLDARLPLTAPGAAVSNAASAQPRIARNSGVMALVNGGNA